jgi:hypothetical protein
MRSEGVLYARCGELELRLEAKAPPQTVDVAPPESTDEDDARRSIEDLLYSSGVEAEPFLRAMRQAG